MLFEQEYPTKFNSTLKTWHFSFFPFVILVSTLCCSPPKPPESGLRKVSGLQAPFHLSFADKLSPDIVIGTTFSIVPNDDIKRFARLFDQTGLNIPLDGGQANSGMPSPGVYTFRPASELVSGKYYDVSLLPDDNYNQRPLVPTLGEEDTQEVCGASERAKLVEVNQFVRFYVGPKYLLTSFNFVYRDNLQPMVILEIDFNFNSEVNTVQPAHAIIVKQDGNEIPGTLVKWDETYPYKEEGSALRWNPISVFEWCASCSFEVWLSKNISLTSSAQIEYLNMAESGDYCVLPLKNEYHDCHQRIWLDTI